MILPLHIPYHEEIFRIPGFLVSPMLIFGFQDVLKPPSDSRLDIELLRYPNLTAYLHAHGIDVVKTLDHFDPRSDLRYDMNYPVPAGEHGQYRTLIDIGCIEHVFDTRQCLENCMRMIAVGGHYMLHTAINGYYGHGLHVFHPDGLLTALEINGFDIVYRKFSTIDGVEVQDPSGHQDILLWTVARKRAEMQTFQPPQQGKWSTRYLNV